MRSHHNLHKILPKKPRGFMDWVLNDPLSLRVVVGVSLVLPLIVLILLAWGALANVGKHPAWWVAVVVVIALFMMFWKRARQLWPMITQKQEETINTMVYKHGRNKA